MSLPSLLLTAAAGPRAWKASLAALALTLVPAAWGEVAFQPGNTLLFYGNSLVERLCENGELEAMVQLGEVGKQLHFRSLAWTGDEVGYRLRPEGYEEHLRALLREWPAQCVVLGYGMNESFAGPAGLADFKAQLGAHLDQLGRLHPGARFVLLGPTAVEEGGQGPEAAGRNRDLAAYSAVLAEAAQARGAIWIDLFAASLAAYARESEPLTENGLHLNAAGNRLMARVIAKALIGEPALARVDAARVPEVARAVAAKAYYVAEVVRPKNADLYYGVRKRPEENAAEIPRYFQMMAAAEAVVHQMAADPSRPFVPAPWLPPLPPIAGRDDGSNTGLIKSPQAQQAEFKVAEGYAVNLFASEVEFPDLRNPVQIAFDARGRLWAVTMPSFPHTVPGLPPQDKIIVLEDVDRDGKADRCTTFAEGLDALDGVAFTESGVLVSEQPKLWLMQDSDGDGKADRRRELFRGIDVTDSHHGGMIATDPIGHVLFCDGVFHRSQLETPFGVVRGIDATTYRLNPRSGRAETEWQSTTPNPWKITYDRTGKLFQMYGDGIVLDALPLTWTPLGIYHPFAYAQAVSYGKGSAAASISSPNFPDEYQQGMASASLLGSYAVSLTKFNFDKGMARGSDRLDVVASPNAAFRPADLAFGLDGALYVSDFCSVIIGHAQHAMRDPHWDHDHGRIWRVKHLSKPTVRDFPRIEGASVLELLELLRHPQDLVRHHARIELRRGGVAVLPTLDQWVAALDRRGDDFAQAALEALYVAEGLEQTRPALLAELLQGTSALHRAAGVQLLRLQAERLPGLVDLLRPRAADDHPRVQMEVIDAVAHLRPRYPAVEQVLAGFRPASADVKRMWADLEFGTQSAKGRSVPVLEVSRETQLRHWLWQGAEGPPRAYDSAATSEKGPGQGRYRTFLQAEAAQAAVLAVRHGYVDISVNGVRLLSSDSMWSNDQQVQLGLRPGLNVIELTFRKIGAAPPAVYCYDSLGQPLPGVRAAAGAAELEESAARLAQEQAALGDALRVQAVPNQLQFSPRELRVKAGSKVRLRFENPDLMLHNLLILQPGAVEEVGALADQMAARPDGLEKQYLPDSKLVLHSTPLVQPQREAELSFAAPTQPGRYPYICTFPGHWRVMRGDLIVE